MIKKPYKFNQSSAFTVLELIVSITVILVLSSLLLASITAARAKGQEAKCINNQKNLVHAVLMFSLDEDKFPTSLASAVPNYTVKVPAGGGSGYAYAASALDYYDGDFTILQCPLVEGTELDDPAIYSYGIRKSLKGISLQLVQTPSETVILVDCDEDTFETTDDIAFRHGNNAIAGFADGHVKQVKWGHILQALGNSNSNSGDGNNSGHGNNVDHDDEDQPGQGHGGHGSHTDPDDPASDDGFDDDELGGGGA